MNTYKIGKLCENHAINFLKDNGYKIIHKNIYFGKFGEIDLVAIKNNCIYFIEVKGRRSFENTNNYNSFDKRKYLKIIKLSKKYCNMNNQYNSFSKRFLLVTVNINRNSVIINLYNIFDF